jgi:hypothetical protein
MREAAEKTRLATIGFNLLGEGGNELQQASQVASETADRPPAATPVRRATRPHSAEAPFTDRQRQVAMVGKTSFAG